MQLAARGVEHLLISIPCTLSLRQNPATHIQSQVWNTQDGMGVLQ